MSQSMDSFAKHSLVYGLSNGINKLIPLVTLPVLSRSLSPKDYGIIAVLSLAAYAYSSVFGLGLGVSAGVVYFKSEDQRHRQLTIITSFFLLAISSIVLVMFCSALGPYISMVAFRDGQFASLILLHATGIALQIMTQPFLWKLQFENQALKYALLSVGGAAISMAAILILTVWSERGVHGWVEGAVIGNSSLLFSILVWKVRYHRAVSILHLAPELLKLGLPHVPAFAFVFLIQYSGIYMLEWYLPLDQVGIYGIGYSIGMALGLATTAFSTAWYPFFQGYGKSQGEALVIFQKILVAYALMFGSLCLLFFVFAEPVVSFLVDSRYQEAYLVIGPIALAQFFLGMWVILLPGVYFAGETYYMPVIQGVIAGIVLTLNFLLIPKLGIQGAAISFAIGALGMVCLQGVLNKFRRYLVVSYVWYRPGLFVGLLLLMGAGNVLASSILSSRGQLITGVAMVCAYFGIAWAVLSTHERLQVLQWAKEKVLA